MGARSNRKNGKYQKKPFESSGSSSDTSANIYESMQLSEAYQSLTARQVRLYVCCKSQLYAEKRKPKMTDNEHEDVTLHFTMNRHKAIDKYKLYTDAGRRYLYLDLDALIEKGFITCLWNGKDSKTKNIYKFSNDWQTWKPSKP